jgi:transcriptional regulator of acetoin/glycerol metabolism
LSHYCITGDDWMHSRNKSAFTLDIHSNSKVGQAWESFTENGDEDQPSVREVIGQSWKKSRELGISPKTGRAETVISEDKLEEIIKTVDLGQAGFPVLNELEDILYDTQHVAVIADCNGRILHSVGHQQIQDSLERINFRPGAAWAEHLVGPNGVGTPIELGRPEIVMGYEHYCQGWHPWVCYGAPVFDVSGKIIKGSIDITGPAKKINKEAMALTVSVAQSVQSSLSIIQFHHRELLRDLAREKTHRWPSDGVMILDENGNIVEYNDKAIKFLNLDSKKSFNESLMDMVPSMAESIRKSLRDKRQIEINFNYSSEPFQFVKVYLEPVVKNKVCIGVALILIENKKPQGKKVNSVPAQYAPRSRYTFANIKGNSKKLRNTIRLAQVAASDPLESNVLLIGETGTGKELLSHSIHSQSIRASAPFIAINCAAMPRDLIESELFGYVAGAFTGANSKGLKGKFESAHNGTFFLDEISSMSLELQAKLLRVLDSMEINRVGSVKSVLVNVRVIAAADEKIYSKIENGQFRLDLFHRLSVLEIVIPKLSERENDVIQLANDFLHTECLKAGRQKLDLAPEVIDILKKYNWPGNVRELNNVCIRWVLTVSGNTVTLSDIPERITKCISSNSTEVENLRSINDELIRCTLKQTDNNISKAARILGIDRSTIYRRRRYW